MITVLLPTVSRPAMLRKALESIAEQTAVAQISRVVVSENGGDTSSRELCQEFPHLPITYFFREPCLPPLGHGQVLMRECLEGEITCILHDDDWWLPNHLEQALAALGEHPEASVYGTNYTLCAVDVLLPHLNFSLMAWLAANYPQGLPIWEISHSNILLGSLANFIVHYSTMVARTEALRQSAFVYDLGNPYDNDRMILFALSRIGPVLFNPTPTAIVRSHANRETSTFGLDERSRRMCQTTEWMVNYGKKPWSAIASAYAKRLAGCPIEAIQVQLLRDSTLKECCLPEIARHLDRTKDKDFFVMYDKARATFAGEKPEEDR